MGGECGEEYSSPNYDVLSAFSVLTHKLHGVEKQNIMSSGGLYSQPEAS